MVFVLWYKQNIQKPLSSMSTIHPVLMMTSPLPWEPQYVWQSWSRCLHWCSWDFTLDTAAVKISLKHTHTLFRQSGYCRFNPYYTVWWEPNKCLSWHDTFRTSYLCYWAVSEWAEADIMWLKCSCLRDRKRASKHTHTHERESQWEINKLKSHLTWLGWVNKEMKLKGETVIVCNSDETVSAFLSFCVSLFGWAAAYWKPQRRTTRKRECMHRYEWGFAFLNFF